MALPGLHVVRPGSGVIKKAIISWLKFNNRLTDHVRNVSVKGAHITRGIQRLPLRDDLKRLLNIMDAKTRVAVSLIAFGGQRPEVIGTYKGKDGLQFGDLTEAHFEENGQLVFDRIPTRADVRAILSKTKKPYYFFLGPEACAYLQAYVAERVARGEKLTKNSPVFKQPRMAGSGQSVVPSECRWCAGRKRLLPHFQPWEQCSRRDLNPCQKLERLLSLATRLRERGDALTVEPA